MKKKTLSVILTAALVGTMLAGCGSKSGSQENGGGSGDGRGRDLHDPVPGHCAHDQARRGYHVYQYLYQQLE